MTKRLAMTYLMTTLLIGVISRPVQAQNNDLSGLQGLNTVFVQVEELSPGAASLGLTKETIQTDIELKLRLAGMHVVPYAEGIKLPGSANLYVRVTLTDSAEAADVGVVLEQNAFLARNGQFIPTAITWGTGGVFAHPTAQIIRDRTKDFVDGFLNAWLSVNPKK